MSHQSKNVIFNDPATIVFWVDGTKTVVKAQDEAYDPEKGMAMAIAKKALGNQGNYCNVFKKWLPEEEEGPTIIDFMNAISDTASTFGFGVTDFKIRPKEKSDKTVRIHFNNEDYEMSRELYDYIREANVDVYPEEEK